jgi:hypothetical protein
VQVDAVPAGRLLWQLTWDQVLSVELAYHRQQTGAPPDGIIVHRKYRSEDTDVLVHDVRCNPNNNQVGPKCAGQLLCACCVQLMATGCQQMPWYMFYSNAIHQFCKRVP